MCESKITNINIVCIKKYLSLEENVVKIYELIGECFVFTHSTIPYCFLQCNNKTTYCGNLVAILFINKNRKLSNRNYLIFSLFQGEYPSVKMVNEISFKYASNFHTTKSGKHFWANCNIEALMPSKCLI